MQFSSRQFFAQGGGGGGGTLIFSYIRRLGPFLGFKILNFDIFGGFQKNSYFWGYEDFVNIFWGSSQNCTILRGHFFVFYALCLKSRYRMGVFFGVAKNSNTFLGCLKFLIFFLGAR